MRKAPHEPLAIVPQIFRGDDRFMTVYHVKQSLGLANEVCEDVIIYKIEVTPKWTFNTEEEPQVKERKQETSIRVVLPTPLQIALLPNLHASTVVHLPLS